jgi:hypothetical protein
LPKRGERIAPPPAAGDWDLRYGDSAAVDGWEQLSRQAPGPTLAIWSMLRADPRRRGARQHPLKGELATRSIGGRMLEQWQIEVTGAGRVWYAIDDEHRAVVLTLATVGHPAKTE